ncbi:HbrB-domain-containing protein [Auriscalpium vulgare]|uniref:HbrB-domain-containing protein n=1 Tax=Auriscalpium vulgare TaxID=40419 RepID=A0ACB8R9M9_9AGAM|nr:HbrB-domain-containing protein [Auriscalpium vulgare]
MHRLGNLAHLPTALTPSISASASSTTLVMPTNNLPAPALTSSSSADNPWGTLHVLVLPLFNGEPLRVPIEDLNTLVKRHIQSIVSNSPPKAVATLETEASDLIGSGMDTLNGKLAGIEEDKLVARVVELWGFFWDQVLPYVEGVLLPLQTDPILSSLYRTPKGHRTSSPTRQNSKGSLSMPSYLPTSPQIDVRTVALRSFRDKIILPISSILNTRLNLQRSENLVESHIYPRLQQMLLVLVSQTRTQVSSMSLTSSHPQLAPGEAAVSRLLRLVRASTTGARLSGGRTPHQQARALSFLSSNTPRDRRGRIAQRPGPLRVDIDLLSDDEPDGGETPRIGFAHDREKEREFLESLRSPDPPGADRTSVGGWGLGVGAWNDEKERGKDDEDDEDPLDWDQAQDVVERMVGMRAKEGHPELVAKAPHGIW